MFRLQHTSVSGFPRCGLIAACLALRLTPPSSNRTCGFPASGSPESSRLKHSLVLQIHQSHLTQMLVQRAPFRDAVWALTASSQVEIQPGLDVPVNLPVGSFRVPKRKIVRPASQMPVHFRDQHRNWFVAFPSPRHLPQFFPFPAQRFTRRSRFPVDPIACPPVARLSKRITQKIQARSSFRQFHDPRFLPIELQSHPAFQLRFDKRNQLRALVVRHDYKVSGPREFHPRALAEPDMNLSTHPAPIIQP